MNSPTKLQRLHQMHLDIEALKADLDALIALEKKRRDLAGPQQPGDHNTNARLLWRPNTERKAV